MAWVMAYYFHGLVSWEWYYPAHFAPLAADFAKGLTELEVRVRYRGWVRVR